MIRRREVEGVYRVVGLKLFELRSASQLTQEQVGRMLSPPMTRAAIAMMEAGKQRIMLHTLQQLASIFRVSLDDLVAVPRLRIAVTDAADAAE